MDYTDLEEIQQEIHYARRIFQQGGFTMVEITNKSIEESSEEVISKLAHLTENNTR